MLIICFYSFKNMMLHWLFLLTILYTGIVAKVVPEFDCGNCNEYFYQSSEPRFREQRSYRRICQMKESIKPVKAFFVTLYDTKHKIPVYSAYTLEIGASQKRPNWMVEPQLENKTLGDDMVTSKSVRNDFEFRTQASDEDYKGYGKIHYLTRGHLNPNAFHDGRERIATFTLTNIAPQYDRFNSGSWGKAENEVKSMMTRYCFGNADERKKPYESLYPQAKAFFITGVIPSNNKTAVLGRNVTIPKIYYTAVCCFDPLRDKKFSFGFYGYNVRDSSKQFTKAVDLLELQDVVNDEWGNDQDISFFEDGCNAEGGLIYVNAMNRKLQSKKKRRRG